MYILQSPLRFGLRNTPLRVERGKGEAKTLAQQYPPIKQLLFLPYKFEGLHHLSHLASAIVFVVPTLQNEGLHNIKQLKEK